MFMKPISPLQLAALAAIGQQALPADTLIVGSASGEPGSGVTLPFRFANTRQIVGLQFDLVFPAAHVSAGSATAVSATTNHQAQSRELTTGRRRVVVYSTTNQVLPNDLFLQVPLALTANSPTGGPSVSLTNVFLTDKEGRSWAPAIAFPKLDEWRRTHFSEAELLDPLIVGDDRDPDEDGVPNLGEYLHGTSPRIAEPNRVPQAGQSIDGGVTYLTLNWRQDSLAEGARAEVELSSDLVTWTPTEGAEPTGVTEGSLIEWQAAVSTAPGGQRFLRLNFKRTTP